MIMTKLMRKRDKIRAQMKSRFYYMFWGAATVAVVGGQLYVGTSYRVMAKSMNRWFDETVQMLQEPLRPPTGRYLPIVPPPMGDFRDDLDLTNSSIIWLDEEV